MNDNGRRHQSIDLRWSASSDGGLAAIRGFVAQVAFWGEGRQGGGARCGALVGTHHGESARVNKHHSIDASK